MRLINKLFWCFLFLVFVFPSHGQQVDAGNGHAIILDENGDVWTVGRNNFGQLGNGSFENSPVPVKVDGLPRITAVARGYDHSMALDENGEIWLWGCNNYGQLGTLEKYHYNVPMKLKHGARFTAIEGGHWHSMALADDSTVWAWGHNYFGELGSGNREHNSYLGRVFLDKEENLSYLRNIVQIASVGYHTLALNDKGQVYSWGSNEFLELGREAGNLELFAAEVDLSGIKEVAVGWHHSVALDSAGHLWFWGADHSQGNVSKEDKIVPKPTRFDNVPKIEKIACGSWHSLALDVDHNVWGWGRNGYGMLGTGDTVSYNYPIQIPGLENIKEIGGGCFQSMAVDFEGNIFTCGDNPSGQQGINNYERQFEVQKMRVSAAGVSTPISIVEESQSLFKSRKNVLLTFSILTNFFLLFVLLRRRGTV